MTVAFRPARRGDVPALVALLRDDVLGAARETAPIETYLEAFDAMAAEAANEVIVGESAGEIVATYQLTFISGLSRSAMRRAQIESVRVSARHRGAGLGEAMFADAERRARAAGCGLIQLTTDASRGRAQGFYERLGFTPSHVGYKRSLD